MTILRWWSYYHQMHILLLQTSYRFLSSDHARYIHRLHYLTLHRQKIIPSSSTYRRNHQRFSNSLSCLHPRVGLYFHAWDWHKILSAVWYNTSHLHHPSLSESAQPSWDPQKISSLRNHYHFDWSEGLLVNNIEEHNFQKRRYRQKDILHYWQKPRQVSIRRSSYIKSGVVYAYIIE